MDFGLRKNTNMEQYPKVKTLRSFLPEFMLMGIRKLGASFQHIPLFLPPLVDLGRKHEESYRDSTSIPKTVKNWRVQGFQNLILNNVWILLPIYSSRPSRRKETNTLFEPAL